MASLDTQLRTLFAACKTHAGGLIELKDLFVVLSKWGVELGSESKTRLRSVFGEQVLKLNYDQFRDYVIYMIQLLKSFRSIDTRNMKFIRKAELKSLLEGFDYKFPGTTRQTFVNIIDDKEVNDIEFDSFIALMIYVDFLDRHFKTPDSDHSTLLNAADIQAILRYSGVFMSVFEIGLVLKIKQDHINVPGMTANDFYDLLAVIKNHRDKIREVGRKIKERTRAQKPLGAKAVRGDMSFTRPAEWQKIQSKITSSDIRGIVQRCVQSGTMFEDDNFPAAPMSLFPADPKRGDGITWKRPVELADSVALFIDGIDQGDIIQGSLNNCWFLSALGVLACTGIGNLEKLFTVKSAQYGLYQCRFYKDGEWRLVTVDDRLPVSPSGALAFGRCRNPNEFWVPLVEKAYAKLHQSYDAIENGLIADALVDLTGEVCEELTIVGTDEFWHMMVGDVREGFILGCAAIDPQSSASLPLGILRNHGYGILHAEEYQGTRLVRVRNPWGGETEWMGAWSPGSAEWTPQALEHFKEYMEEEDGAFFMTFQDFCLNFTNLYVVRITGDETGQVWPKYEFQAEWKVGVSAGGCVNFDTWSQNTQFKVLSNVPDNRALVSVRQPDRRLKATAPNYHSIGLFVLRMDKPDEEFKKEKALDSDLVVLSTYANSREITIEFKPQPGVAYAVIPSTFEPNVESRYVVTICTQHPSQVTELSQQRPSTAIQGQWSAGKGTSGGNIESPMWRDSPQYLLSVQTEGKYRISIQQHPIEPLPPIGFVIFKADDTKRKKLTLSDFVLVPKDYIATPNVAGEVSLTPGDYMLLISTDKPGLANTFTLEVTATGPGAQEAKFSITEPAAYKKVAILDEWKANEAGGCRNHPTWQQNPYISLTLGSKQTLSVVLGYAEPCKDSNVGFYVFAQGGAPYQLGALLTKSKFTPNSSCESFRLDKGSYLIVPTTFQPNVHRRYFLEVYSDADDVQLAKVLTKPIV